VLQVYLFHSTAVTFIKIMNLRAQNQCTRTDQTWPRADDAVFSKICVFYPFRITKKRGPIFLQPNFFHTHT